MGTSVSSSKTTEAKLDPELKNLHGKINNLMSEAPRDERAETAGMSEGEHKMLAKARESFGPRNGRDWRKAAV